MDPLDLPRMSPDQRWEKDVLDKTEVPKDEVGLVVCYGMHGKPRSQTWPWTVQLPTSGD